MVGKARRADGGVLVGMSTPLDTCLVNFISHHGIEKVNEIITTLGDCTKYETRVAFEKMVSDFNSKPLIVDEDEDEDQVQDLEDEDEDQEDVDEGADEEDEDKADVKACKQFGDTKRASLVKRLHAPIEGEHEPKKPRVAKGSCVQGDKTEAAGI